jgi:hypothetical protein
MQEAGPRAMPIIKSIRGASPPMLAKAFLTGPLYTYCVMLRDFSKDQASQGLETGSRKALFSMLVGNSCRNKKISQKRNQKIKVRKVKI